jgi:sugar O-acyltransferase (sialic acid O-acetyltransferase NeuD family)
MVETDLSTLVAPPRDLVIVGAGGFAPEGIWVAEDTNAVNVRQDKKPAWNIRGFVVYDPAKFPQTLYSYPVLGTPKEAAARLAGTDIFFICMIADNSIREAQAREAEELGWKPVALVHPTVIVARETTIGPGSYIGAGSIISPFAQVGAHVVVNNHVSVGHDSVMEDFSQACPGARISGRCVVGRSAFIGSNATLLPRCRVGEGAVVGANSVALRSVARLTTVMGVPAKVVSRPVIREHQK